jgi:hypothetical protein
MKNKKYTNGFHEYIPENEPKPGEGVVDGWLDRHEQTPENAYYYEKGYQRNRNRGYLTILKGEMK